MYTNGITADIESEIRLFADDCVCNREIKNEEDTLKLQRDIDRLGSWARKWGMRFQTVKCNMMQLTNKRSSKIQANYTLEDTVLENVESIKYLGVTITNDLKWNTHISNVCTKANRALGFLRRNLYSCPQDVKEAAYKGLDQLRSTSVPRYTFARRLSLGCLSTNVEHTAPFTRVCRLSICITQGDHVFRRSEFLFMLSSKTSGLIGLLI